MLPSSYQIPNFSLPRRPFSRRSFPTTAIANEGLTPSAQLEQSLAFLDVTRQRQAETGQLLPRSARKTSLDAPTSSDTSGNRMGVRHHVQSEGESAVVSEDIRSAIIPLPLHGTIGSESNTDMRWRNTAAGTDQGEHAVQSLPAPNPANGVSHLNTATRRVNPGFEILPVGTLQSNPTTREWGGVESGERGRTSGELKRNRLQKHRRTESDEKGRAEGSN